MSVPSLVHDEAAAFAHVEAMIWADGADCPHCGNCGMAYEAPRVGDAYTRYDR